MRRILITGATGFIGRHLLPALPADMVRIAIRPGSVSPPALELVSVPDIDGLTDWDSALENIECVIHLAARVHVMKPKAEDRLAFEKTNVLGTARLASMAAERGVKRFIFLSSIKVNGEISGARSFTSADLPNPQDIYGVSKWRAEARLFEIAAGSAMDVVAIRSPLVYGPGVRANFLRLMRLVHVGLPLPLGAAVNRRSMVSVWNMCDLIRTIVMATSVKSGVVMVSDGVDLSTHELILSIARCMRRPARLFPLPMTMLRLLGALAGKNAEIARLCDSLTADISVTRHFFSWAPPVSVEESLQRTVCWYLGTEKEKRR